MGDSPALSVPISDGDRKGVCLQGTSGLSGRCTDICFRETQPLLSASPAWGVYAYRAHTCMIAMHQCAEACPAFPQSLESDGQTWPLPPGALCLGAYEPNSTQA